MDSLDIAILVSGGLAAGVINTLAGGGSMLTVPLLVLLGLPGTLANGTNRAGILVSNLAAVWSFRRAGVDALQHAVPVLLPVALGSLIGALAISRVTDETFERSFGLVMLAVLLPTLRAPKPTGTTTWSPAVRTTAFLAIGVYGGAFQAGVGVVLLLALGRSGYDLVTANAVKVVVIAVLTLAAIPVFAIQDQIAWLPAALLAVGFGVGGALGARFATRGGERLIRPVLAVAAAALAARMLGLL